MIGPYEKRFQWGRSARTRLEAPAGLAIIARTATDGYAWGRLQFCMNLPAAHESVLGARSNPCEPGRLIQPDTIQPVPSG